MSNVGGNIYQGVAYLYRWNGTSWIETKFIASDGAAYDNYGWHVAIDGTGNAVIVGSVHATVGINPYQGAVYVYKWNGSSWMETKITSSDGQTGDWFGRIVAMTPDGNCIAVGAYMADVGGKTDQGAAYLYRWNGSSWVETKFTASDGAANDYFGYGISISGDGNTIIVGSIYDTIGANSQQGSAYIFRWDGFIWNETKLTASDGLAGDHFGYSVYVTKDGFMFGVTSPADDIGGNTDQGSFYLF